MQHPGKSKILWGPPSLFPSSSRPVPFYPPPKSPSPLLEWCPATSSCLSSAWHGTHLRWCPRGIVAALVNRHRPSCQGSFLSSQHKVFDGPFRMACSSIAATVLVLVKQDCAPNLLNCLSQKVLHSILIWRLNTNQWFNSTNNQCIGVHVYLRKCKIGWNVFPLIFPVFLSKNNLLGCRN